MTKITFNALLRTVHFLVSLLHSRVPPYLSDFKGAA